MIDFGRDICSDPVAVKTREWLVTNGIGGSASGTLGGALTRRYHGLLMAALHPPLGRTLLLAKLDEVVNYDDSTFALSNNCWVNPAADREGSIYLERFHREGTIPVWTYACGDALLEKRVWMQQGANTTYIRYTVTRASAPLHLKIKTIVNYRDYHSTTKATDWAMQVTAVEHGERLIAHAQATPYYLFSDVGRLEPAHDWYRDYLLSEEVYRGFEGHEDNVYAGTFHVDLLSGQSVTVVASTEANASLDSDAAWQSQRDYETRLLALSALPTTQDEIRDLVLAADQFIVSRPTTADPDGKSVIAGYPWFGDWGRDTMISLPGLTLTTGRPEISEKLLRTFAQFIDQGMLPNRFPDQGEQPEYNTVDATLWYFVAIQSYYAATQDITLLRDLFPALKAIIDWHIKGTRYQIHVDPVDGLLYAGEAGVQLTWMDAKVDGWVVTPRIGKPVEINALWYNALCIMADFAALLGESAEIFLQQAARVKVGFQRFWNDQADSCHDVLDTPPGLDPAFRPNQLFAISLPYSPLSEDQQKIVVDACARRLLTSHGLRSLASCDPFYIGHYGGSPLSRDRAYHQGTVWGWLIGPFVSAHLRVYKDKRAARQFLQPLIRSLSSACIGSLSEIFDGDAPFSPQGCYAQAWTVAEVLRLWQITGED